MAFAEPAYTINYQGKLADNTGLTVANGSYDMEFKLYTQASGGAAVWTETRTGGNAVTVANGLFSVMLGSVSSLGGVNFNQPLYLGVNIDSDGEMTPRKPLGTVPSAFEARHLGGIASSSFLRSDVADTASGLLTFTGGFVSSASSTISGLTALTATTTNLIINGERFTDLTGTGLAFFNNTLTTTLGTIIQASEIANGDHGFFSYSSGVATLDTSGLTSADLLAALTNETGTGSAVFSASPTLTGTLNAAAATLSSTLTMSGSAANIALGSNWLSGDGGDEGIYVDANGNVGIGTSSPDVYYKLYVDRVSTETGGIDGGGILSNVTMNPTGDASGAEYTAGIYEVTSSSGNGFDLGFASGLIGATYHNDTSTLGYAQGAAGFVSNLSTGTITDARGLSAAVQNWDAGDITSAKSIEIFDIANTGTITNTYGLYIGDLTAGTQTNAPYAIYSSDSGAKSYFAGNIGIGTTTPWKKFSVSGGDVLIGDNTSTYGFIFPAVTAGFTHGLRANGNDLNFAPYFDGIFSPAEEAGRFRPSSDNTSGLGTLTERWSDLHVGTGTSTFMGRVGIGTTTPNLPLHVFSQTGEAFMKLSTEDVNNQYAGIVMEGWDNSPDTFELRADLWNDSFEFRMYDTNMFVIDYVGSTGRMGIGDDSPDYKLDVETNSASSYVSEFFNDGNNANRYGIRIQAGADDGSGTTYYLNAFDGDGGNVGYIANTSGTFAVTDVSDVRTKVNITDTEIESAISIIRALRVVDFNRRNNPEGPRITGFIAQEVEQVYSPAITYGEDGYLGVMKDAFIPILVKGQQELNLKLEDLATTTSYDSLNEDSFIHRFYEGITKWLADSANGISRIFAREVETELLCVGKDGERTCLTKDQLDELLSQSGDSHTSGSNSELAPAYAPPASTDSAAPADAGLIGPIQSDATPTEPANDNDAAATEEEFLPAVSAGG